MDSLFVRVYFIESNTIVISRIDNIYLIFMFSIVKIQFPFDLLDIVSNGDVSLDLIKRACLIGSVCKVSMKHTASN